MAEKNKIVYGNRTFTEDSVKSGNLYRAAALLSTQLEADTLTVNVKCTDPAILKTAENSKLLYFRDGRQAGVFYAQSIDRIGPDIYKIYGVSAMGLLQNRLHAGGIYTGQTAETIIRSIVGTLPFSIKSNLKDVKLYGWLPYNKPPERSARDNLLQVIFALGASIWTDSDGTLRIAPLWDGASGSVDSNRMYDGGSVEYEKTPVTAVSVTEHQYMIGGDEKKLFDGEAQTNDIITFSEPMYSLSATGFRILESGANYAKLSSGTGTLTGRQYIHVTRQIQQTLRTGSENVKSVSDATLISLVNSKSTAQRMAAYYKCSERIQNPIISGNESPGDIVLFYHPFDKTLVSGCIENADTSISNTLKSNVSVLLDYSPPQISQTVTYDHHQLITSSGTVTLPDGVNSVRAILIGGGNGGTAGQKGSDGTAGSDSSASSSSTTRPTINTGPAGKGGAGGSGSAGGAGGRVASFEINGNIKSISVTIGGGGNGGSSNGSAGGSGGNTTIIVNGTTYSSASGSATSSGYQDLVTGIVYATSGGAGKAGAQGGEGGAPTGSDNFPGSAGSSAGSNSGGAGGPGSYNGSGLGGNQGTRSLGGGGGGGAAYNASGGTGGTGSGSYGGSGGTGATGTKPSTPARQGCGGVGGNGGGGGGGGGGTLSGAMNGGSVRAYGGSAGVGGSGGPGGNGAPGCVILYYGVQQEVKGGALMDKNGKFLLDRLGRIIVT